MSEQLSLLGLPVIDFHLILEQLHKDDIKAFHTFRLVSRACRDHSERLMFRKISLSYDSPQAESHASHFLDRLQDPNDEISQCVRHLEIGPFKLSRPRPSSESLENALRSFSNLQSLTWNTHLPIPEGVLDCFHITWPSARLHVKNRDRMFYELDRPLLSSPQLHTLDYSAQTHQDSHTGLSSSELPAIMDSVAEGKSLKVLRLGMIDHSLIHTRDWRVGPSNFDFHDGATMPNLEELQLPCDDYDLSAEHSQQWKESMDWKALRRLDVGEGYPQHLFSELTGEVPNLKSLRFGFREQYFGTPENPTWNGQDADVAREFLESINGLEEVMITSNDPAPSAAGHGQDDETPLDRIWPSFLEKHGSTLRKLEIKSTNSLARKAWTASQFSELLDKSPNLETLDVPLATEWLYTAGGVSYVWPDHAVKVLGRFQHLRSLKLGMRLHNECKSIISVTPETTTFNEPVALGAATSLFERLFQTNSAIEEAEVIFSEDSTRKKWLFRATRSWGAETGKSYAIEKEFPGEDSREDATWESLRRRLEENM